VKIYIYTLRFNLKTGGGSHHALAANIRSMREAGHIPILTTFHSSDNAYSERPCEMREENFGGGFISLQHHVAKRMLESADANVHLIFGPTLMWAGGIYKRNGGAVPVVVSLNNYTPGMGLQSTAMQSAKKSEIFLRIRKGIHRAKWYVWEKLIGIKYARAIDRAVFDSPIVEKNYADFGYRFKEGGITIADPAPKLPVPQKYKSPYPSDPSLFHVLFAARLIYDKGPDNCVKAAIGLPENIHMHLIGSGSDESSLRKLIHENGLEKRVHLHGWKSRAELSAYFQHAHLFVHPCRWPEPFGLVIPEALSFGLPVVVTENTGAAWAAGNAGITFKKDDVEEFRKHILYFYKNPLARAEYLERALVRSRELDPEAISRQFVKNLESVARKATVS